MAALICCSYLAGAQGCTYTPFIPNRSSGNVGGYTPSPTQPANGGIYQSPTQQRNVQSSISRATAYAETMNGYAKLPIQVRVYSNGVMQVVSYFRQGPQGGEWCQLAPSPASVSACSPMLNSDMEKSFMYKAWVNNKTYYFDL